VQEQQCLPATVCTSHSPAAGQEPHTMGEQHSSGGLPFWTLRARSGPGKGQLLRQA
jgi:hypothetical protein